MNINKIHKMLSQGKKIRLVVDKEMGFSGIIKQSIDLPNVSLFSLKHIIECFKNDNKPYVNSRYLRYE